MTHSQLKFSTLSYEKNLSLNYFAAIADKPWAMLLHSASTAHSSSRFDIIVADPLATLTHQEGINEIQTRDGVLQKNNDIPFLAVKALQDALLPSLPATEDWPFLGGALGLFGYDLGRQVESLPRIAERDIQLPDMAIGIYDWALIVDHKKRRAVIIEPASSDRITWLSQQKSTQRPMFSLLSAWQSNMTKQSYQKKFNQVKNYILSGDCYQINLAQRFHACYQGDEWQAYTKLAQFNAAPFSAFIRLANNVVLSLSPERFLQLDGDRIETQPIKGTKPRDRNATIDKANARALQVSIKDRAENLMIVDLLRNDIGRVAKVGTVRVPSLFAVESFPAVHHLVSTVTGQLSSQYAASDLLNACFPGGSITGAPKVRAMEIIEELEPHRRNLYCGSIGYISRCGKMDTSITIRTLICEAQKIYAWAGGGLVMDSDADAEYQETLDKLNKILPLLERTTQQA